jgi:uncharacterized membrane protein
MKRILILVIALPILALGAGVVAGILASRLPGDNAGASPLPTDDRTELSEELQLSPQQRDQMRGIWEGVQRKVQRTFQDAQDLQKQRDDALLALLNDQQKAEFEKIAREFADRYTELSKSRDRAFHDGVDQTVTLLDNSQREKYDQILRSHVGSGVGDGPSTGPN